MADGEIYDSKSPVGSYAFLAPEVLNEVPYGKSIDWYQVGVTLYKMVYTKTPFYDSDVTKLMENIKTKPLELDQTISAELRDLLTKLLTKNPYKRLGANGAQEIKSHAFFADVDWQDVLLKRLPTPKIKQKELKDKSSRIKMEALLESKHKRAVQFKDPRLAQVSQWDFFNETFDQQQSSL